MKSSFPSGKTPHSIFNTRSIPSPRLRCSGSLQYFLTSGHYISLSIASDFCRYVHNLSFNELYWRSFLAFMLFRQRHTQSLTPIRREFGVVPKDVENTSAEGLFGWVAMPRVGDGGPSERNTGLNEAGSWLPID